MLIKTKFLILIIAFFAQSNLSECQCLDNKLVNGSFDGDLGGNNLAPGWKTSDPYSPDINDANGQLNTSSSTYIWIGEVVSSSNGGTWQNIFGPEVIIQKVSLEMDKVYSLCFEYSAQGITNTVDPSLTFDDPVGVEIYINNNLISTSPLDMTQYSWEEYCIEFTAVETENEIKFRPSDNSYLGIDGACLTEPDPSSIKSLDEKEMLSYPNPVSKEGIINFGIDDNSSIAKIRIINSQGQIILNKLDVNNNQIKLSDLNINEGVYYFSIIGNYGKIYNGRFVCF
jgi:hypothetical protein